MPIGKCAKGESTWLNDYLSRSFELITINDKSELNQENITSRPVSPNHLSDLSIDASFANACDDLQKRSGKAPTIKLNELVLNPDTFDGF